MSQATSILGSWQANEVRERLARERGARGLRNTAGTPGLRATLPSLSQDFVDYVAVDIGEPHIAATEMEGEFLMVHS